jgi:hypothetical protein
MPIETIGGIIRYVLIYTIFAFAGDASGILWKNLITPEIVVNRLKIVDLLVFSYLIKILFSSAVGFLFGAPFIAIVLFFRRENSKIITVVFSTTYPFMSNFLNASMLFLPLFGENLWSIKILLCSALFTSVAACAASSLFPPRKA